MKVKLKGLALGILIGIMLTTSVAFTSSTSIKVYFNNLKVMLDGVENNPAAGELFIYQNKAYVPIRFVSEALGKEVKWDEKNRTIWIGKRIVAVLNDGAVWNDELDSYLDLIRFFNPRYIRYERQSDYRLYMLNHLIATKILTLRADEAVKKQAIITAQKDLDSYKEFNTQETPEMYNERLTALNLTESDLLEYLTNIRIIKHVVVSEEQIKAVYDNIQQPDKTLEESKEDIRKGLSESLLNQFMKDELPGYIKEIKLP
ncbi:MAG TPA: copper amine oxidase N-terminal domain-containing protein [Bacilli bacterium]